MLSNNPFTSVSGSENENKLFKKMKESYLAKECMPVFFSLSLRKRKQFP